MTNLINLKNIEKWKKLNQEKNFSIYDYIYNEVKMNEVSSDIYFAFLELFWPEFILYKDRIFLKENFSEKKFEELKNKNVEFWINFLTIDPYFEDNEDGDKKAELLSKKLVDIWKTKLKKDFPQLDILVTYLEDKETGDCGLTFYQKKYAL